MQVVTTSYYDPTKYEVIGLVSGVSVHAISAIRGMFSGISSLFGGKQQLIEQKFLDVYYESIASLQDNAKKMGAEQVVALKVETSELGNEFVVFTEIGTAIRPIKIGGRKKQTKSRK